MSGGRRPKQTRQPGSRFRRGKGEFNKPPACRWRRASPPHILSRTSLSIEDHSNGILEGPGGLGIDPCMLNPGGCPIAGASAAPTGVKSSASRALPRCPIEYGVKEARTLLPACVCRTQLAPRAGRNRRPAALHSRVLPMHVSAARGCIWTPHVGAL